jgi:hypothetical protein
MHASTQERFKHTVPPQSAVDVFRPPFPHPDRPDIPSEPSSCRVNITFRFFRPDFLEDTPRCKCGIPCVLRPDMKRKYGSDMQDPLSQWTDNNEISDNLGTYRYWWMCNSSTRTGEKSCGFWKAMDVNAEGRGPFVRDRMRVGGQGVCLSANA